MPASPHAIELLDRHFLELRCELLNLAATLDRIAGSANPAAAGRDPRMELIQQGLGILSSTGSDRAERIQLLFSDEYVEGWNRR